MYQFRSKGMDGHPFIELPHPISNLTPEEMRALTLRTSIVSPPARRVKRIG